MTDRELVREALSKVPAVTLGFWIIKILATTLGETGGDSVTMTWLGETTAHPVPNGYLIGTAIFGLLLVGLVWAQIRAKTFNPWLYWATIVASTTCGTTLADFADRSLGIGYPGGSLLLLACVLASLFAWHRTLGTVDVNTMSDAARGDLLLDHDHLLADARHRARRLDRRLPGARLFRRRARVRRRAAVLAVLYFATERQPRRPVLGGVHPDPAARRDGRRFPRQADRQGRPRIQPPGRLGRACGGDRRPDPDPPAAARATPGGKRTAGVHPARAELPRAIGLCARRCSKAGTNSTS